MVYYHTCSCALDPSHSTGGCLRRYSARLGLDLPFETQTHTSLPSLSTSRHVRAPALCDACDYTAGIVGVCIAQTHSHGPKPAASPESLVGLVHGSGSSCPSYCLILLEQASLTASSWRATCQSDHGTSTIATTLLSDSKCMTLVSGVPTKLLAAAATSLSAAPMTCDYERQRQVLESEVSFRQQGMMDKRNTEDRALSRCYSHCARSPVGHEGSCCTAPRVAAAVFDCCACSIYDMPGVKMPDLQPSRSPCCIRLETSPEKDAAEAEGTIKRRGT